MLSARKDTGISPAQAAATGITQPGALTAPYTRVPSDITSASSVAGSGVGCIEASMGSSIETSGKLRVRTDFDSASYPAKWS